MPLEQINASLQRLHSSNGGGEEGRRTAHGGETVSQDSDYDAGQRIREHDPYNGSYGDEDLTAWAPTTPIFGAEENAENEYRHKGVTSIHGGYGNGPSAARANEKAHRPMPNQEDMTLLKLGGVGGVQRSGSAKFGKRISSRSTLSSTFSCSPEDREEGSGEEGTDKYEDEDVIRPDDESLESQRQLSAANAYKELSRDGVETTEVLASTLPASESVDWSFNRSPRRRAQPLHSSSRIGTYSPHASSPSRTSSNAHDLKARIDSLTLSAAAQAQSDAFTDSQSSFVVPEPRRHTGSFALRSRSALSRTLGSATLDFGSGQGRAAARKAAVPRTSTINTHAKRTSETSDIETPRALMRHIQPWSNMQSDPSVEGVPMSTERDRDSTLKMPLWQPTPSTSTSMIPPGIRSAGVSPRSRHAELAMSPFKPFTLSSDDGLNPSLLQLSEKGLSPIALASPDAEYFDGSRLQAASFASHEENASPRRSVDTRSPSLQQESEDGDSRGATMQMPESGARDIVASSPNSLGVTTESQASASTGVSSALGLRPGLARSSTSLATSGLNVLRTPTTEEWSKFLLKQGVDPAHLGGIVQTKDGLRSRSNTTRSMQGAGRRRISERETALPASASMSSDLLLSEKHSMERFPDPSLTAEFPSSSSVDDGLMMDKRIRPRSSVSSVGAAHGPVSIDDLESVDEEMSENEAEDLTCDVTERPSNERRATIDGSSGSEEGLSDGLDERMRALHEAISRPPSRLGTPAPSESGMEKMSGSMEGLHQSLDSRRLRWPSRETAASLNDYPLPPFGEQRSINDFVTVTDIGRGAYGLVKKARVKDEMTGEGTGPEFCIKYIIKSRILADCWRRHKVLGPIPIEIHVLDQLRRLSYHLPTEPPAWSPQTLYDLNPTFKAVTEDDRGNAVCVGHPALCMMVDFFEDHEFYYMVMPCFGTGQDLFDYIESQPHGLSTKQVRCIFGQLADGLHFLHKNNIVHRDVKDENVILDGNGFIQLIDFGSAAHINTRNNGRLFDTFSGTLDYAAAEILRGEKYGGKEQDVWALGVVGYVLLCGDCPFWNGEEAMEGVGQETRAYSVLSERCRPLMADDGGVAAEAINAATAEASLGGIRSLSGDRDGFTGLPIERMDDKVRDEADLEAVRRQVDLLGQSDGGGRLEDAADLIIQCLQLIPAQRPSMEQICQHRFLTGQRGWRGLCGWQECG